MIKPQTKVEKEILNVSVDKQVIADLDEYCLFLNGSQKSYVVEEMIRFCTSQDKKFQAHQAQRKSNGNGKH